MSSSGLVRESTSMQPLASIFFILLLGLCGVLEAARKEITFRQCSRGEKCVYVTECSVVRFHSAQVLDTIREHSCALQADYLKMCCPEKFTRYKKSVEAEEPLETCGQQYRISPPEFPWLATVTVKDPSEDVMKCSGSLISERFVLTAAECVVKDDPSQRVTVLLGDLNVGGERKLEVDYVSLHPSENAALLHLEKPVTFTQYISPICLEDEDYNMEEEAPDDNVVIEVGWENSSSEAELRSMLSMLVACPQASEGSVCALAPGDHCYRTLGGPLMKMVGKSFTVVGIATSSNTLCAGEPAVYTSVQHIMPWILDNVL